MTQENIPVQPGTLDGERGIPTVNENGSGHTRKVLLILFVVGFIIVLLLLLVFHMRGNKEDTHHSDKTMVQTSTVPMRTFKLPPAPPPEPPAPPPAPAMPIAEPAPAALSLPPLPDDTPAKDDVLDKSASALMVVTTSSGDTDAQPSSANIQALLDSKRTPSRTLDRWVLSFMAHKQMHARRAFCATVISCLRRAASSIARCKPVWIRRCRAWLPAWSHATCTAITARCC